ncbi:hypothetical protein FB45DRAFT_1030516 [Roridomyces roridus]|uniref:Uncharacterized protein n=1 Tax=Roridomyces roridus TaxID=1738132 RepID=A0AAD7BL86_9AGAR|nr:hypothetical protein FB45DRAFT_1030516 [Roridomyces roridus]
MYPVSTSHVEVSDELTQNFRGQVGSFTAIWHAVRSDCREVAAFIGFAEGFGAMPLIFWKTMNNVTCMYEPMADLREWCGILRHPTFQT